MEDKTFTRYQCWKEDRIVQVINKEAVSVEKSNFLATHAPLNKIRYERSPQEITDKSEQGLFDELRRCNIEQRHTFAVVQGIPGTGKSHLIRWLKETYTADNEERQGNDVVVLIERAQCNLRGTLMQIIASDAFKYTSMRDHLEKLKKTTDKLSSDSLEENILDQLRIATNEVKLPDEHAPSFFIKKRIIPFMLDLHVRPELKKTGGPIGRISRYLSTSYNVGIGNNELPGFQASDFEFSIQTLNAIKNGGYKEAKELAERLYDPDETETRQELADYLNHLLQYAVERTTALSTDDLKQIFNELRRQLRQQDRQLALFIEDITAFTGIDKGLIDVLATQHTGESNREFCRLISVIGITDNYFNRHFPDNMKERVTHHLTLNASSKGNFESDLLQSPTTTANMSARYLNAIRLSQEDLDDWVSQRGARLEHLPNACERCKFKVACHGAFGAVNVNSANSDTPQAVGLYPFNETAIWVMYQQMSTTHTPRTPRSLLSNVLSYVLESHGKKIPAGTFPPLHHEMGSAFKAPAISKISQRQLIQLQATSNAARVESLILFWGTRTIDSTGQGVDRLVGGLSKNVFQAFDVPFIEGENVSSSSPQNPAFHAANPDFSFNIPRTGAPTTKSPSSPIPARPPAFQKVTLVEQIEPTTPDGRYTGDINAWLNGAKLQYYDKLGDFLRSYIITAIDWDIYNIPKAKVDERVKRSKIVIEDQAGKVKITSTNDYLEFERSFKFGTVLEALDHLNDSSRSLKPAQLGGYLTSLSSWLDEQEERIIEFVQEAIGESTEKRTLTSILIINGLLLACLQGNLEYKAYSAQELLLLILEDCVKTESKQWSAAIQTAETTGMHSKTWISLMKGMDKKANYVHVCRQNLLQSLNRSQGGRSAVRFIDAAFALEILQQFEKDQWLLAPLETPGSNASLQWAAAYEIYNSFEKNLVTALADDQQIIKNTLDNLQCLLGDSEPKEVFNAINAWTAQMKKSQQPYKLDMKASLNASRLSKVKSTFGIIAKEQRSRSLALRLSEINTMMQDAQELSAYFQSFSDMVNAQLAQLHKQLTMLQMETGQFASTEVVIQDYNKLTSILIQTTESGKEVNL